MAFSLKFSFFKAIGFSNGELSSVNSFKNEVSLFYILDFLQFRKSIFFVLDHWVQ